MGQSERRSVTSFPICLWVLRKGFPPLPPVCTAPAKTLCQNHQSGREQEVQKADGKEGRAGAREARRGEHEEEPAPGHQVSSFSFALTDHDSDCSCSDKGIRPADYNV